MNWIDHILRERALAGTALVTLSTGTEEDLYPLANIYSGRLGIPFRCADNSFVIDFDFGGSPPTIKYILLLGANLENITANAIRWGSGAAPAPALSTDFTLFTASDSDSDWIGTTMLSVAKLIIVAPVTHRYHRIQFTQTNRQAAYSQIGEIWFEETGDHAWFDDTNVKRQQTSFAWPLISGARLDHERESRLRGGRLGFTEDFSAMDIAGAATLWEAMFRESQFCFSALRPIVGNTQPKQEEIYGTRLENLTIRETYQDDWNAARQTSGILKTMDGDGKI